MDRRDLNYDLLLCSFSKVVLLLLVVICHSGSFWCGDWFSVIQPVDDNTFLSYLSKWLGTFHIFGFALISGYIYYYIRYEKLSYEYFSVFLKNKTQRLLVPYAFVCLFWVIPISYLFYHYPGNVIISKFLLGKGPSQLWFLLMLLWTFVFSYYLSDFYRRHIILSFH